MLREKLNIKEKRRNLLYNNVAISLYDAIRAIFSASLVIFLSLKPEENDKKQFLLNKPLAPGTHYPILLGEPASCCEVSFKYRQMIPERFFGRMTKYFIQKY